MIVQHHWSTVQARFYRTGMRLVLPLHCRWRYDRLVFQKYFKDFNWIGLEDRKESAGEKRLWGVFNKNKFFFPQLLFPLSLLFPTTNMKVWLFLFKKRKTFTVQKRKSEKKVKMLAIKMDMIKAPALKKLMFIWNFRYIQVHGVWPTKAEGLWNLN